MNISSGRRTPKIWRQRISSTACAALWPPRPQTAPPRRAPEPHSSTRRYGRSRRPSARPGCSSSVAGRRATASRGRRGRCGRPASPGRPRRPAGSSPRCRAGRRASRARQPTRSARRGARRARRAPAATATSLRCRRVGVEQRGRGVQAEVGQRVRARRGSRRRGSRGRSASGSRPRPACAVGTCPAAASAYAALELGVVLGRGGGSRRTRPRGSTPDAQPRAAGRAAS